jgi:hypothetical protein
MRMIILVLLIILQLATWNLQPVTCFASAQEQFVYDSRDNRDPFMPLLTKDGRPITTYSRIGSIHDIIVEGILYDPQGASLVIINDMILKQADTINGVTVKKIEKNSVLLSFKGEDHTFKIKE